MHTTKTKIAIAALLAATALSGCTRIQTGNVGILRHWDGTISPEAAGDGFHTAVLDSYVEVDTTQTRADVKGLQPKDANGVSLKDVEVVVTFSLNPARVAPFYLNTKELDREPNSDFYTLGLGILEKSVIPNVVQKSTEAAVLTDIAKNLTAYQESIQAGLNARLDQLYPGINPFKIKSVSVLNFKLPDAIQAQVDARAGFDAAASTIKAQEVVVQERKDLLTQTALISTQANAAALAIAAKSSGLSPDQIIAWEKARAYSEMASKMTTGAALISTPAP
jgi:hypothetical protein